jgi:hypothetical protein
MSFTELATASKMVPTPTPLAVQENPLFHLFRGSRAWRTRHRWSSPGSGSPAPPLPWRQRGLFGKLEHFLSGPRQSRAPRLPARAASMAAFRGQQIRLRGVGS